MRQRSTRVIVLGTKDSATRYQNPANEVFIQCQKPTSDKRLHKIKPTTTERQHEIKPTTCGRPQEIRPTTCGRVVRFRSRCEEFSDTEDESSGCSTTDSLEFEREDLPNGSDVFQQILREMTGTAPEDFGYNESKPSSICGQVDKQCVSDKVLHKPTDKLTTKKQEERPRKSILKRRKNSRSS